MIQLVKDKELIQILSSNYIGFLGYIFQNRPFVVPITYYYCKENNCIIGYTEGGQKTMAMRKNNFVSLEVAEIQSPSNWRSVLVHGEYKELSGVDAKYYLHDFSICIKDIIRKKELKDLHFISEFSSKIYDDGEPIVFQIKINEMTGRKRKN
ncbi:flavin mononucleotide-binding protein [Aureibaculum algae]|uniref:Flavin mononucleotide-binding protein n=1 Tax=Aureibaculum algae TaxID=2584122 RepID=A0A5B7TWA6_9FLAO|nr:pyridoxamine 5'-phosphate oxidase family protein [Aureibaculum algae]QCX39386.1 flavin mononucleotide-binding protein [Aureibaculum algae]